MTHSFSYNHIPMIALRGLVAFPGCLLTFEIERDVSLKSLKTAMNSDRLIFLAPQKSISVDIPDPDDVYGVGTLCRIKQCVSHPGGGLSRVMAEGLCRAKVDNFYFSDEGFFADIVSRDDITDKIPDERKEALIRTCLSLFEAYSTANHDAIPEQLINLLSTPSPAFISNYIAQNIPFKFPDKIALLKERHPFKRLNILSELLNHEISILEIENELSDAANESISKSQRDYFLREELRIIREELGEDYSDDDIESYRTRISALPVGPDIKEKLLKEVMHLAKQPFGSSEASVIRGYLDTCLEIPWGNYSQEQLDLPNAAAVLDEDHYGLDKVKKRIIQYLAVQKLKPDFKGGLICLVGPPGTGKTSVAMSIARATNRKLVRISLGGVHDEAEIRGHRKTYIGSMPGRIINGIIQAGTCNPVMVLDEIDKLGSDYKGDPSAALLEVLDPEQNSTFRDNFLEIPFDLSKVFFITTANTTDTIPAALLDRMEIIELSSYTDEEKLHIAKEHLIKKQRQKHGISGKQLRITDDAIRHIIADYTRESGVRQLEREIASVCRNAACRIAEGKCKQATATCGNLFDFLGPVKFKQENARKQYEVGLVRGLAYTAAGGETLDVEVSCLEGTGKIELTGNLGDVMKESAKTAVTVVRKLSAEYGIQADFYKTKDIHIHFPEAAVPKDGPSAGITICTAILSALAERPVRQDVSMTGEISLRGKVMPIGGLREKTMASLRAGVKNVIIPYDNLADLDNIDANVREKLNFFPVKNMSEVLEIVLGDIKIPDSNLILPCAVCQAADSVGPKQ